MPSHAILSKARTQWPNRFVTQTFPLLSTASHCRYSPM
jgi:hypothetical protein